MARDVAYSHAEKEIEKIAYKKQKHLDLSVAWNAPDYEWLSELPESLGRLTWLESLNLEGNTLLTTLPAWFGQLTNLKSLNVSWNQLTILPETIGNLKKLQFLTGNIHKLRIIVESKDPLIRDNVLQGSLYHLEAEYRLKTSIIPPPGFPCAKVY